MLFNTRKFLLGFIFTLSLLPMLAFASAEFKGTETVNINKLQKKSQAQASLSLRRARSH